ncbi:MAG: teicoplanin resistance protein VanZ [Marinosulfonomonas sp.]
MTTALTSPGDQVPNQATRKWVAISLTAALALVIAILTLTPVNLPRPIMSGADKVYHFVAFAALMLPVSTLYPRALIWLIPWALIFGGVIELIQPLVDRSGEWADFWADTWGVAAGLIAGVATHYFVRSRARHRPN